MSAFKQPDPPRYLGDKCWSCGATLERFVETQFNGQSHQSREWWQCSRRQNLGCP